MLRIEVAHTFDVSVAEAFAYITDMKNWPEYWPDFIRIDNPAAAGVPPTVAGDPAPGRRNNGDSQSWISEVGKCGLPRRSVGALWQTTFVNVVYELGNLIRGQVTARIYARDVVDEHAAAFVEAFRRDEVYVAERLHQYDTRRHRIWRRVPRAAWLVRSPHRGGSNRPSTIAS